MNSPLKRTALMGLIALGLSGAAAYYYPWPEADLASKATDEGLFREFEAEKVAAIRISAFNEEKQIVENLSIEQRGDRWIIPARAGFPTDNIARRAAIVNAVVNLANAGAVFEQISDSKEDHLKYGVVDPAELSASTSRAGIGTKVILEDRNQQELASVIVGAQIEGQTATGANQAFVRVPGQPNVYLADFNPDFLSVTFRDWVDPNLFEVATATRTGGERIRKITVISPEAGKALVEDPSGAMGGWKAELAPVQGSLELKSLKSLVNGMWISATTDDLSIDGISKNMLGIGSLPVDNAQALPPGIASKLSAGDFSLNEADRKILADRGFSPVVDRAESGLPLNAAGGAIVVATESGIEMSIGFGRPFASSDVPSSTARLAYVWARADESVIPEPELPTAPEGQELSIDQQREARRLQDERKQKVESLKGRVAALNKRHGSWLYVMDETSTRRFFPVINVAASNQTAPPAEVDGGPETTPQKNSAENGTTGESSRNQDTESGANDGQ